MKSSAESTLQSLLSNLPDLVFRLRLQPEVRFLYLSSACEALLGQPSQELLAQPDNLHQLVHPEDHFGLQQLPHNSPTDGRAIRFRHASGQVVWMEVRAAAGKSGQDASTFVEGVARPLNEQQLEALNKPISSASEHQRQQTLKLEAVGRLAGGIAHDFNNLLHVIQGHTQIMQGLRIEDLGDGTDLFSMLTEVDRASTRAAGLVRQLLCFGRSQVSDRSEVDLDRLLRALHGVLQSVLGPHIQLVMKSTLRPAIVEGNAAELEQVVSHLCVNAREACTAGGFLTVSLDSLPAGELSNSAHVGRHSAKCWLCLTVQDDGKGMSEAVQEHVFEPFFTTKPTGQGAGLGLATAYAIVQAHQGFMEATSIPGSGSTFRVYLPQLDSQPIAGEEKIVSGWSPQSTQLNQSQLNPAPEPSEIIEGNQRLAIVAEDEPAVLTLTASYLRQAGFRVVTASSGPAAERLLEEHGEEIEIAVLDAVMPGFGAEGVQRAMVKRNLVAPVLYMTGYQEAQLPSRAGAQSIAILRKPFGPHELLTAVGRLLQGRSQA